MKEPVNRVWQLPADAPANWNPVADLHAAPPEGERLESTVQQRAFLEYCYWIPNVAALQAAGQYAPLLSMGAGTCYAEELWRMGGIEVVAVDIAPPPHSKWHWRRTTFGEVLQGDEAVIPRYPEHTLLLCCPPGNIPMASTCLDFYRGQFLILVGQRRGGSGIHGDKDFHKMLETDWEVIQTVELPNWRGDFIDMRIFRRR